MQLLAMLEFQTKTLQIKAVNVTSHTETAGYFLENLVVLVNVSTIIVFIPILNHLIFPIMDMYTPNMRKRIGIGLVVTLATPVTAALIEGTSTDSVNTSERPFLFVIPVVLLTISETFVYVPGKCYIIQTSLSCELAYYSVLMVNYSTLGTWPIIKIS